MEKILKFLLFLAFLVSVSGCRVLKNGAMLPGNEPSYSEVINTLKELTDKNVNWLSKEGWVHYSAIPSDTGILHLTTHDRWIYIDEEGFIQKEFYRIYQNLGTEEVQRFVITEDNIQGELFELRDKGLKALDYAVPKDVNDLSAIEISCVGQDLKYLQIIQPVISNISMTEALNSGNELVIVSVEILGNSETKIAGIPSGSIGKKEVFTYDKETGQRIKYLRSFLSEDEQWDEGSYVDETIEFSSEIPSDVLSEYQDAENELDFYARLFRK